MVIAGDFKVDLVDAHTKVPYPEHYKDGRTYVEVEPDAEYYIKFQRIATTLQLGLIVSCSVDGKGLGWQRAYRLGVHGIDDEPCYRGSMNRKSCGPRHEFSEENTLVFAKPKIVNTVAAVMPPQPVHDNSIMSMGKVDFNLYEREYLRNFSSQNSSFKSEMAKSGGPTIVSTATKGGNKKKHILSSIGKASDTPNVQKISKFRNKKGILLQRITLNYCTVPGLFNAGVLSRQTNVDDNRSLNTTRIKNEPIQPLLVQPQRICETITKTTSEDGNTFVSIKEPKYYDLFDLSTLEDDPIEDNVVKTEMHVNNSSNGTTPDLPISYPQRNTASMGTGTGAVNEDSYNREGSFQQRIKEEHIDKKPRWS